VPLQSPPARVRPAPCARLAWCTFLGVGLPSSRHQPAVSLRRASISVAFPSAAFLTPSTAYATTGLAGLFHPTATSRVLPSGGSPLTQPFHLVGGRTLSSLEMTRCLRLPACATLHRPALRVLIRVGVRASRDSVNHLARSFPSWAFPPPGLPSPRGESAFTFSSTHDLGKRVRPVVLFSSLQCVAHRGARLASLGVADLLEVFGLPLAPTYAGHVR